MARTFRGVAQFSGVPAAFDVILYPIPQSGKLTHEFDVEVIKDANGDDTAKRAQNERLNADIGMKLLGDTAAHALAGAAFLAPLAIVTISAATIGGVLQTLPAAFVGAFCLESGSEMDLGNSKTGDITFKLVRYVVAAQNTVMTATPS